MRESDWSSDVCSSDLEICRRKAIQKESTNHLTTENYGIQVIKEHRDILPADTPVRDCLRVALCTHRRLLGMERVPLCGGATAENLCAGQRQVADARPVAGHGAEPPRRSEGLCR